MRKIRKNTQLSLINPKGAGRPAKNDKGIRHTARERISKLTALHLTIKVRENKADIKNKRLLGALHHAIIRARLKGLRIIHYTLEFNHVHLLVEAYSSEVLHKGMQSLGISFSKAINKVKSVKGTVYKHRYHFRKIGSRREYKIVLTYILGNGIKHKRTKALIDPFNSCVISAEMIKVVERSDFLKSLRAKLQVILCPPKLFAFLD